MVTTPQDLPISFFDGMTICIYVFLFCDYFGVRLAPSHTQPKSSLFSKGGVMGISFVAEVWNLFGIQSLVTWLPFRGNMP